MAQARTFQAYSSGDRELVVQLASNGGLVPVGEALNRAEAEKIADFMNRSFNFHKGDKKLLREALIEAIDDHLNHAYPVNAHSR